MTQKWMMATYEYYCNQCGTTLEIVHPMTASPEIICATCTKPRQKKFGLAATVFKGGGWGSSNN